MRKTLCVGLLIWTCGHAASARPEYELTALEPAQGYDSSCASGINDVGQIVGESYNQGDYPSRPVATLWQGAQVIKLDTEGRVSAASAVNRHGRIVGTLEGLPDGNSRAFSLRQEKGLLHLLPGQHARARAINDRGVIVGAIGEYPTRAFVYERGSMTLLDVPAEWASGTGINNAGAMVVTASWEGGTGGFIYENGGLTDLGPSTSASAINASGVVAGWRHELGGHKAFLYVQGSMQPLANPVGMSDCYAKALNDVSVAVGFCEGGNTRIVVMWRDGRVFDLFDLLADDTAHAWSPSAANGVNRSRQITGCGWRTDGKGDMVRRGFVLNPIRDARAQQRKGPLAAGLLR